MFILDVPSEKIENFKQLLNKENINNQTVGPSADGLHISLKFNKKKNYDKAVDLLSKGVVYNKVAAQATIIHPSSTISVNIGDAHIDWCADKGDPSAFGGNLSGDAFYDGVNGGVVLTENTDDTNGHLYWEKTYDFTKNIYLRTTTYSGEGSGADGITIYMGTTSQTTIDNATDGIAVYIDEYNSDTIKVYKDGELQQLQFYTGDTLDNQTFRLFELVYEYISNSESYLHVLMNNTLICRVPFDGFIPSGNYIGIGGLCIGLNNYHVCRAFAVMSGNPWLKVNR